MNSYRLRCVLSFLLFVFLGFQVVAQEEHSLQTDFYYSDGQRVDLVRSDEWVAVRFREPPSKNLGLKLPDSVDLRGSRDLHLNRLTLLPVRGVLTEEMRKNLAADLVTMPEIQLVAPVFRSEGVTMVVTDEFVARFADEMTGDEIARINERHGVEIVRRLLRRGNSYVLRVEDGDALGTANIFHRLAGVVYAHPDFVRVFPPRPNELQVTDRRIVLGPDGTVLDPEMAIEKGRDDLRVMEPVSDYLQTEHIGGSLKVGPTPVTRVTIENQGLESGFPTSGWVLYGTPTWDDVSYRAYLGSMSAYCVGSSVTPPGPYPVSANSWMVYGPFSLSDAEDARVTVKAWVDTEAGYDYFSLMASVDGSSFYGTRYSGNWASASGGDGWMNVELDLKRVYSLGDLRGEPQVWFGLKFDSDTLYNYEGVYADEILIEKITGGYQSLTTDDFDHLQWSLSNNEQLWGITGADIQATDAWGVTHGSDAITIAVLDDGVDLAHPDLAGKLVPGYDATDGGGSGGPTRNDAHGTGCAGIAAAITDNSLGVAGIARAAKIMPVRIFYEDEYGTLIGADSWTANAIDWAVANGADVLSNSWKWGSPVSVITEAINDAKTDGRGGLGSVVVVAAGNDNGAVSYPANLDTTLAVGALSPCDERKAPTSCDAEHWWGSNYGAELDIGAPGVHMYTTDMVGSAGYDPGDYNYNFNGTSSAAPVVAGVAALVLGQTPAFTADDLEAQLLATADDLGAPGWDAETGYGRVNAYRALTEGLSTCYQLTLGHTGSGLDPTPVPTNSPGCAAGEFFEGTIVTLTAVPAAGWVVSGWSGTDDDGSTATANTVTMPASSHSASVSYGQIPCYTLTSSHTGSGADPETSPESSPGCDAGDFHAGEIVSLSASPLPGWAVNGWTGTDDDTSVAPVNLITMPASAHGVSVEYVSIPAGCYALTRKHLGSGADPTPNPWHSTGCPGSTYVPGENISLQAVPDAGWTVGGWAGTVDDSSFLWTNAVSMPANDHQVIVRYLTPMLVKDIRTGSQGAYDRDDWSTVNYTKHTNVGSTLFFAANDGVHGMELWKTNGSESGTSLVKDIWPGSGSGFPWSTENTWFSQTFVNVNGTLFFVARDDTDHEYEVWKSDGTEAGTVMVKDIYDSWDAIPQNLTNVDGTLFFSHTDGTHGEELWKSDGTLAGTVMVKDIKSGGDGSALQRFAAFGDLLIFSADDGSNGAEPWISDGTESGTVMLKDINPSGSSNSRYFTQVNGSIFFSADDGTMGSELWKTDGTTGGTVLVKEISPEGYGVNWGSDPSWMRNIAGALYFQANDQEGSQVGHGEEFWKSDGTEEGTVLVKDIWTGYMPSHPSDFTLVNGTTIFRALTPDQGSWGGELWQTDGTESGTVMLKDTYPGENPINYWPTGLTGVGGALMFSADDSVHGRELWFSDGTEAGTHMVRDLRTGAFSSWPDWLIDASGVLFFRAYDVDHGTEIWALVDPAVCQLLTVNHTGLGADLVADPTHSDGCDVGLYEAGEIVTLTANPYSGWSVAGWNGSDNDGSTGLVNSVTMPAVHHTVSVIYTTTPIFVDGFESGDTSAWSSTKP